MKYQTVSTTASLQSPGVQPEFRGNLILGVLLGINVLIALPSPSACANAPNPAAESVSIQSQNGC